MKVGTYVTHIQVNKKRPKNYDNVITKRNEKFKTKIIKINHNKIKYLNI